MQTTNLTPRVPVPGIKTSVISLLLLLAGVLTSPAQNGTWTSDYDGVWSDATNWFGGVIASGSGNTAIFSNDLASAVIVNLDSARTVGSLLFVQGTYTITNNGPDAVNILTLDGPTKPLISIPTGVTTTIRRTVLAGTGGFIVDGGGTLALYKEEGDPANTISGDVILTNSIVAVQEGSTDFNANDPALDSLGSFTFYGDSPGSTLNILSDASTSPSYGTVNNNLIVPGGQIGTIILPPRFTGATDDNAAAPGEGLGGTLTGSGTFNVRTRYLRGNVAGDWSAFTGQLNITPDTTGADNEFRFGNPAGYPNASVDLGGTSALAFNYYRALTTDTTIPIGVLSSANTQALLTGSDTAGFTLFFDVGAKHTSSADSAMFAGRIADGTGPAGLIKRGAGTLAIYGDNTHSGGTTISNGVLEIGDGSSETGTLGTGPVTNFGTLVIKRGGSLTVPGNISGSGNLIINGLGSTITLTGTNTYTGPTAVMAGKLLVGTASAATGGYTVSDSAGLGTSLASVGASLTASSIAFGSGCTFDFELTSFGNPAAAIVTNTGSIVLNGDVTVNVAGTRLSTGTITLLQYGSRSGGGNFVKGSMPAQILSATLNDDRLNSRVTLTIHSMAVDPTLQWVGDAVGNWDIGNTANPVWRAVASGQLTNFNDGLPVRFDDSATGTRTVNLTTFVSPAGVTVSNSVLAYKFSGPGAVTGTTGLTKQGTNTLTLATYAVGSEYSGPTTIEAGILEIGDGVNPGSIGGGVITNHGTLRLNSPVDVTVAGVVSGTGSIVQAGMGGAILTGVNTHTGGVEINLGTTLTLESPGTAGGAGATVRINDGTLSIVNINVPAGNPVIISNSGVIASSGGNRQVDAPISGTNVILTFNNSSLLTLNGNISGVYGTIVLGTTTSSLLRFNSGGANNCFGSSNALFVVPASTSLQNRNGGTIDLGGLEGAGTLGGPQNANNATVNFRIGNLNTSTLFSGTIDNGDLTSSRNRLTGITKVGTGSLTFSNASLPYFGPTVISNGVLALAGSGSPSNTVSITISSPGVLNASSLNAGALYLGFSPANSNGVQILRGDGIVQGNLVLGSSARMEPGFSIGTLTVNGNATLDGTILMELDPTNSPNSDRLAATRITYGGTLNLTNIGGAINGTHTFQLFSGALSGTFASVITQQISGVTWDLSKLNTEGSIILVGPMGVSTTPTNLTAVVAGNTLQLSWPASHLGWQLQMQTNSLSVGLSTNWIPVADSTATNKVVFTIDPAIGTVFFRLLYTP
jgi:autotransporter-associated beta strand protein